MKRKYDKRLVGYLNNDLLTIGIFILAIICGSIYALYIKDRDNTIFLMLSNYILLDTKVSFEIEKFLSNLYNYCKQLMMIWLFGLFSFTLPLSIVAFFVLVFSYAFTTTCIILTYGFKGLIIGICTYGFQAVVVLAIGMYLQISSLRGNREKNTHMFSNRMAGVIPILAGSCMVSLIDILVAANLYKITSALL